MCGIAGILTSRGDLALRLGDDVARMNQAQRHRGPDDGGQWLDVRAGIGLGFRRLAILDLSPLGAQPMHSASGRYVLAFNGEVYNYRELRPELERYGVRFRGQSDTEVVLAAIECWGVERAVRRFVGMFGMAVWDVVERRLHLIRDRVGKKPLYVYAAPGVVAFASELKALAALPWFERTLDRRAVAEFLRYLYVPAPRSIFERTRKLLPGHLLTISDADLPLPAPRPYWDLAEVANRSRGQQVAGDDLEVIDEAERLLRDAAGLRLRSDVPLGAFLSGGIDSSLTVALMQAAAGRPVRTFAIGFDHAAHDESKHAALVARHLGTEHTGIQLSGQAARELVPRLGEIFDEPFADASQLPTLLICEAARRAGLIVAISGDGGDELFAGYNRYVTGERMFGMLRRMPAPARRLLAAGLRTVPVSTWDRLHGAVAAGLPARYASQRLAGEKLHKAAAVLPLTGFVQMYGALLSAWPSSERVVWGAEPEVDSVELALGASAVSEPLSRMMLADQRTYLPDDLLAKVDRASMAVSLEVRVPLLDHRVVEWSWRLPRRYRVRAGQSKWILRQVLARHVPPALTERPKVGFTVPIGEWLRGPLRPWAEGLLDPARLERGGVLRAQPIQRAWQDLLAGRGRWANAIWAVLMYQAWEEQWLG